MERLLFLLIFPFISSNAYSQDADTSTTKIRQIPDQKEIDFPFYCDNEIEARFPGGMSVWAKFVQRNYNINIPINNKAPGGKYMIRVTFMINKNGAILNIKTDTNFGYGIEAEMIKAIKKCPKWIPATNCGKKINSFRQQPITLIIP